MRDHRRVVQDAFMQLIEKKSLVRVALVLAPSVVFTVIGCGGSSSNKPNEVVPVDKAAEQTKEKMIQDAYKNKKPIKTEAQSKADMIKNFQKSSN